MQTGLDIFFKIVNIKSSICCTLLIDDDDDYDVMLLSSMCDNFNVNGFVN